MYFDKEKNRQERRKFVEKWAEYVRTHSDKDWSRQQNMLINSLLKNALNSNLTKEQWLEIKSKVTKKHLFEFH